MGKEVVQGIFGGLIAILICVSIGIAMALLAHEEEEGHEGGHAHSQEAASTAGQAPAGDPAPPE